MAGLTRIQGADIFLAMELKSGDTKPILIENAFSAIVLTAKIFNPSIFSETWLVKNDVVNADELVGLKLFSPEVTQFQTSDVEVIVIPPKLQIRFGIHEKNDFSKPLKVASRTVELLPNTPYQALGVNFDFFLVPPLGRTFLEYDRALLGTGPSRLLEEFSSEDARFGRYFSKDHETSRLKFEIKPVIAGPAKNELLNFSFNFHHELEMHELADRKEKILEAILRWKEYKAYAEHLVELGGNP